MCITALRPPDSEFVGLNASTAGRSADAEAVLKIRALLANGDFDRYWTYHLGR
ncbi:hypothetical protein GCM10022233_62690 [Streptomyces shaanxiensis]|uniref:Uncharacterized protein n=1 Tax=Streptomyces shaanxiensis TaxID=653357 RepID=A0ABP7VX69_9ACTN